ncbi:EF-hand domain-containing protein [Streptomyces ziwulingensis]|uniref:EF-hand domain-containing protein n=1 Tax=Streptomyces ziwulingensis TaxID=1045501 RepID=A0ABP9B9D4_9ACTN
MSDDEVRMRLERHFDGLDRNRSGYMEWEDWRLYVNRVTGRFPRAGADRNDHLSLHARRAWEWIRDQADADGDGRVSREEFVAAFGRLSDGDTAARLWSTLIDPASHAVWAVVDQDGDGRIDEREFADYLELVVDLSDMDVAAAFRRGDQDGDGYLNRAEWRGLMRDYYMASAGEDTSTTGPT